MSKKFRLSRRSMLRGMVAGSAVSIGMPALDAMLNSHGTAFAQGQGFPKRFGVWFQGCGVTGKDKQTALDAFFPKTTGPAWEPSRLMMPLVPYRDYMTIVGGTQWGIAENTPHHTSRTSQLSGSYNLANAGNGGKMGPAFDTLAPSIDRIVAEAWKGQTRIDSVEMACSKTGKYCGMISFMPGQLVAAEFNPANVFKRLFGASVPASGAPMGGAAGPGPDPIKLGKARRSVLDAVLADTRALQKKLGKADSMRMESHLGGLREVETQITALEKSNAIPALAGAGCQMPSPPPLFMDMPGHEDIEGVHKAFADMMVIALACDLTRVFSMEFIATQSSTLLWQVNFNRSFHDAAHSGGNCDPDYLNANEFAMKSFAYLLGKLKASPQGTGNLLDSMCIYGVNEYLVGASHSMKNGNHPIVIVGKANGALKPGSFIRPPSVENGSKVCVAMLRALGINAPFGVAAGMANEPLPGILA